MLLTYQEIYTEILTQLKATESGDDAIDSAELDSIKLRVNQIQDWIGYDKAWEWRKRTFYLTTLAPEEIGTVTVTAGSRTVTGSGTSWDDEMRIGFLIIGSKPYKIQSVTSTTELILEAEYPNDTESGASYKIVFPDYILNHEIASIVSVKINNAELEHKKFSALTLDIAGVGEPLEYAIGKRFWEDFYNSSTVAVINDSTTITLASGTWPDEIAGLPFRVNDFSKLYTIKSKDSATTATLEEVFEGTTASGKSYAIGPKGSHMISFRNSPDARYFVEIEALVKLPKLVSATQYSIIPQHGPLLHGSIWLALHDFKDVNPVRIQQARADFERSMNQLNQDYSSAVNLKWTSPEEIATRKSNLRNFNPLRDDFDYFLT